jgi:hypothetical protein
LGQRSGFDFSLRVYIAGPEKGQYGVVQKS